MPVGLNETPVGLVDPACPLDWSHPLNRGLVSRWKVVPNSGWRGGLTFRDLVRGGKKPNDGTLSGTVWRGGGIYGQLFFDGSDDYVSIPTVTATDAYTISVLLTLDSASNFPMFATDGASSREFRFYSTTQQPELLVNGGEGPRSPDALTLGRRYLVTGTMILGGSASIYVDGVPKHTITPSSGGTFPLVYLGCRSPGNFHFPGKIEDVLFWNRKLTDREVQSHYQDVSRGSPETLRWVGAASYGLSSQAAPAAGNLFRYANLSGLQGGGPFFVNPLGA